jgi:hypothetical protein
VSSRANVASSFTISKGAMIEETYAVCSHWDFSRSKRDNLAELQKENYIGAGTVTWLGQVAKVLNRRLDPEGRDRPLVILAQRRCDLDIWKPLLLWHITRDEFLFRDFLINWLYPAYTSGALRVRPDEVHEYLRTVTDRGGTTEHAWSENTFSRVSAGLLRMAADFGLLRGSTNKEFGPFHLPDPSYLYLLHAMWEESQNARNLIQATDWRMYLLGPEDVERELLQLHQFRKLDFHFAGSLMQLSLPYSTLREYAEKAPV